MHDDPKPEPEARPSKSQRKRDMSALQDIGAELVALNADQLAQVDIPDDLRDAVAEAQRIRDFEGRRRQLQYIGRLMREVDPEPIRARLAGWRGENGAHTALLHHAERWRERLLAEADPWAEFATACPRADLQNVRTLVASVRRDRAGGRAPRNYRALFRVLREALGEPGDA